MYEQFFHLKTKPFDLVPNPEFLFLSKGHKKAITYLNYGIREKVGFILLTGEIGSGKTTILRNLIKELKDTIVLSKIFNTKVTSDQLIAMINEDFGLQVSGKDKVALLRDLYEFLIEQYAQGLQPILLIDEAQNLSIELLEEVRMLSNLESDRAKLLQIILVGQPELRATLARPELTQFRQRISLNCHLKPLSAEEVTEYIYHRLEIAGNRDAVVLSSETFERIYQFSRGIPRLVNIICDFLMISAFVEQTRELSVELVNEVVGELEEDNRYWEGKESQGAVSGPPRDDAPLLARIERLEENLFAAQGGDFGTPEISEKLASLEGGFSVLAGELEAKLKTVSQSVRGIMREMELLKENAARAEEKSQELAATGRRGVLRWITRQ